MEYDEQAKEQKEMERKQVEIDNNLKKMNKQSIDNEKMRRKKKKDRKNPLK